MEEIKQGYKQTDIGLIPEDWEIKMISELSRPVRGGSPRPAGSPRYFNGNFIPWLTVASLTNVPVSQIIITNTESSLTEEGSFLSRVLEKETLIIANSGATLGVAKILGIKCCANDGIAALLNINEDYNKLYIVYQINNITELLRKSIATGNGQPNLNTELIGNLRFPFPTRIQEQTAIATALSDTDALIAALDKKIAKKQQIKQGAMQQLLTGKKRLPGFSGEWVEKTFGEMLTIKHGRDQKLIECVNGKYPILGTGGIIGQTNTPIYSKPSVLIGRKGTIDKPYYYDTPFWTVDTLFFSEIKANYDAKFIYYIFNLIDWYMYNEASGVPSLNAKVIESIRICVPSTLNEQTAIAQTLTDMGQEISRLEKERDKYEQLKAGMMQVLLTGKIRICKI